MPRPRFRFTIQRIMVAVAVIAVFLAWLDVRAAFALVGLGLVVIIPAAIASPGRRLKAGSWASSLQPAVVIFYLYATWVTAWCVLEFNESDLELELAHVGRLRHLEEL
jgi:hypothetical protein